MQIDDAKQRDWAGNGRAFVIAWGLPVLALVAGSTVDPLARSLIWSAALIWMGTACLLNARRCGRVHCRFTGPFFLILIVPVLLQGMSLISLGLYAWWILGAVILVGSKLIWWVTEAAWGRFSTSQGGA